MLRIAFTAPEPRADEISRIRAILDNGWDYLHLRHPGLNVEETEALLSRVPQAYRSRITLHDHFELAAAGLAGGIHLNGRNPKAPEGFAGRLSRSCHSTAEIENLTAGGEMGLLDYATLSPLFESVSKPGYGAESTLIEAFAELSQTFERSKIIGLGGITPLNAAKVVRAGFGGIAVLGSLFGADTDGEFATALRDFKQFDNNKKI